MSHALSYRLCPRPLSRRAQVNDAMAWVKQRARGVDPAADTHALVGLPAGQVNQGYARVANASHDATRASIALDFHRS